MDNNSQLHPLTKSRLAAHAEEFERMREAYTQIPDSASEADDWANCEAWEPQDNQ
ncbi:MAG: hypothetical protein JST93_15540 [Acidobacteria bacterium]|nr:hypothetical protein [Acidobacteriota bacterium]